MKTVKDDGKVKTKTPGIVDHGVTLKPLHRGVVEWLGQSLIGPGFKYNKKTGTFYTPGNKAMFSIGNVDFHDSIYKQL